MKLEKMEEINGTEQCVCPLEFESLTGTIKNGSLFLSFTNSKQYVAATTGN